MINEVPVDFAFQEVVSLESIESGMRAVYENIKVADAVLAVSLGRIKRDGLFYKVAPDFKTYLRLERTDISYSRGIWLAAVGEKYWEFQTEIRQNGYRLSKVMSKVRMLDRAIIERDPMFWERFSEFSVRELKSYMEKRRNGLNVSTDNPKSENIIVKGASLSIDGQKIKGLNLNEAREKVAQGKRLVCVWIDDNDKDYKRVSRSLDRAGIER